MGAGMAKSSVSAAALAAATDHFRKLGMPHIDIPEWMVDGKPLRIYWKPLTAAEQEELGRSDAADLDIFVRKALDANGDRLFDVEDKLTIKRAVAPQIISRVAVRMMLLPTVDDAEKN